MNMHLCQKTYVQLLIEENPLICTCHHRYLNEILAVLPHHTNEGSEATVELVQQLTGASTGCGSCLAKVEGIVQCYQAKPEIFTKYESVSTK